MLALRYGYAVTPVPAAQVAPWAAADLPSSRWMPIPPALLFAAVPPALALVVLGWAWAVGGAGGSAFLAIVAYVGPVALLICVFILLGSALANQRLVRQMRELIEREPWQAWPCRVERTGEEGQARRVDVRVSLLAPDHSVAARHDARFRPETWRAMTDGYGVLLFAGDVRFNGVIADPRTRTAHLTHPVTKEEAGGDRGNSVIEDELTRQAIGWMFSQ
ncbi:hypothetical protein [Actinomadura fibrosa]|uniref:Uncharacterized protein n=1 Tax=Actinomadura fibrosa TaxID=111802 RepID=A0ABW2XGW4_9ACTN|nr:hypothetical protein [Actinomadura fibrosa]